MANRRNAIKKIRADEKKRGRNRGIRSELRTLNRHFLELCSKKEPEKARESCRMLFSKFDKAVKKGVIQENTANRKKSRFARRLQLSQVQ